MHLHGLRHRTGILYISTHPNNLFVAAIYKLQNVMRIYQSIAINAYVFISCTVNSTLEPLLVKFSVRAPFKSGA